MVPVSQHERRFLQHMLEPVVFVTPSRNYHFSCANALFMSDVSFGFSFGTVCSPVLCVEVGTAVTLGALPFHE